MSGQKGSAGNEVEVGLCAGCRHAKRVLTQRSTFWLCRRSATDPSFAKYPRLPVLTCRGYEPEDEAQEPPTGAR